MPTAPAPAIVWTIDELKPLSFPRESSMRNPNFPDATTERESKLRTSWAARTSPGGTLPTDGAYYLGTLPITFHVPFPTNDIGWADCAGHLPLSRPVDIEFVDHHETKSESMPDFFLIRARDEVDEVLISRSIVTSVEDGIRALYEAWKLGICAFDARLELVEAMAGPPTVDESLVRPGADDRPLLDPTSVGASSVPASSKFLQARISIRVAIIPGAASILTDVAESRTGRNYHLVKETNYLLSTLYPTLRTAPPLPEAARRFATGVSSGAFLSLLVPDPPPVEVDNPGLQPQDLEAVMHPFQRGAVGWMLNREGVTLDEAGQIRQVGPVDPAEPPVLFVNVVTELGLKVFYCPITGMLSVRRPEGLDVDRNLLGGILADEMGTGKTIMTLALILLHRAGPTSFPPVDPNDVMSIANIAPVFEHPSEPARICWVCKKARTKKVKGAASVPLKCAGCSRWAHDICAAKRVVGEDEPVFCDHCSSRIAEAEIENPLLSAATLIIAPDTIVQQWESEIALHAPGLRVYRYSGKDKKTLTYMSANLLGRFDVVLTTYEVLRSEVQTTRPGSELSLAGGLGGCEWTIETPRCGIWENGVAAFALDEGQMVESADSSPSGAPYPAFLHPEMASRIPRFHPWAVSGTPMGRTGLPSLHGVLSYLEIPPLTPSIRPWERLAKDLVFRPLFHDLLARLIHRNTKRNVASEMNVPPQTETTVRLSLEPVERAWYDTILERMLQDVGTQISAALGEVQEFGGFLPHEQGGRILQGDVAKMRGWLKALRQACCHPQVGTQGRFGPGIKTMPELLRALVIEANRDATSEEREGFAIKVRKAQIYVFRDDLPSARSIYEDIEKNLDRITRGLESENVEPKQSPNRIKGEGKQHADVSDDDDDPHMAEFADATDPAERSSKDDGDELESQLEAHRRWLEIHHRVVFLLASVYHTCGDTENENKFYEKAANIRAQLLTPARDAARFYAKTLLKAGVRVGDWDAGVAPSPPPLLLNPPYLGEGDDPKLLEAKGAKLLADLNRQWEGMGTWRTIILDTLAATRGGGVGETTSDATGDEFTEGIEQQDKAWAFIEAFTACSIARRRLLTGEGTKDTAAVRLGQAKASPKRRARRPDLEIVAAPVSDQNRALAELQGNLKVEREALFGGDKDLETRECLRSILLRLRALGTGRERFWSEVYENAVQKLQRVDAEILRFGLLFNARAKYFRQLQAISDQVTAPEPPEDLDEELGETLDLEDAHHIRFRDFQARHNYLRNLLADAGDANAPRQHCTICISDFDRGVMTPCMHVFCRSCIVRWMALNRTCPICVAPIPKNQLVDVTLQRPDSRTPAGGSGLKEGAASSSSDGTVSCVASGSGSGLGPNETATVATEDAQSAALLARLSTIPLLGSYGTKIDTLVRHVIDVTTAHPDSCAPAAKAIIFSQWEDMLDIVAAALDQNKVGFVGLGREGFRRGGGGIAMSGNAPHAVTRFREEDDVKVFMLHAKNQSAGLTLIRATHVFMVEPMLDLALEAQAVGRVHRIGQRFPTQVWRYVVRNTVEDRCNQMMRSRALARQAIALTGADEGPTERDGSLMVVHSADNSGGGGEVIGDIDVVLLLGGEDREETKKD
ncbi:SNF2 family N-terminal domain-containing protein [Blyttiomyces helicus]|uniref:SNF2 family N-terminal domain-containing protein n=1 Tax=Blyttiomyces helicus TaxID=388810 RepID=A0A4P9WQ38_9FUNG|nr:SNF2 family N-terminal domain-containing protein [Blyttiomyces helicus]|eukprot:RKO93898.1 SNF2 family N-terminal domain-containing protein [Blyttiomyces helicus]